MGNKSIGPGQKILSESSAKTGFSYRSSVLFSFLLPRTF